MASVRARRADLAPHDSAERLSVAWRRTSSSARPRSAAAEHRASTAGTLKFRRAVIATGSRPAGPSISGPRGAAVSDERERLRPARAAAVTARDWRRPDRMRAGTGFCAAWHQRHGRGDAGPRLLPREDPRCRRHRGAPTGGRRRARSYLVRRFVSFTQADGQIKADGRWACRPGACRARSPSAAHRTRRASNLDAAGLPHGDRGIAVDDRLRTSNRRVFAAGDVCSPYSIHPRRRCDGAHRDPERAVFRPAASQLAGDSVDHLHVPGSGARR